MKSNKNYTPGTMSFSDGFLGPKGDVGFFMSVDNEKAKNIVSDLLKNGKKIESAVLGLDGDFSENSTTIYDGKQFHDYDAYEGSQWATPILIVNYKDGSNESFECWYREIQSEALEKPTALLE